MIYPAFLIVISLAAVIYLFGFVLPGIFDSLSSSIAVEDMPSITMVLKDFSDFVVSYRKYIIMF
jgi:type II secretory pathway component PulF